MASTRIPSFADVGTNLITLEIGDEKHKHVVHKDLLMRESPYFKAMLTGSWKESSLEKPLPVPLATNHVFVIFLDWLYFRRVPKLLYEGVNSQIPCYNCNETCHRKTGETASFDIDELTLDEDESIEALIETKFPDDATALYIFADSFDVPSLREQLVNQEWRKCVESDDVTGGMMSYSDVIRRFRHLPASSPYCRLQVDEYVRVWKPILDDLCPMERKMRSKLTSEFTFGLAAKLADTTKKPWVRGVSALCDYHEHAQDEETKSACMRRMDGEEDLPRRTWKSLELKRLEQRFGFGHDSIHGAHEDQNAEG